MRTARHNKIVPFFLAADLAAQVFAPARNSRAGDFTGTAYQTYTFDYFGQKYVGFEPSGKADLWWARPAPDPMAVGLLTAVQLGVLGKNKGTTVSVGCKDPCASIFISRPWSTSGSSCLRTFWQPQYILVDPGNSL
jgi:hypothetical protein